MLNDNKVEKLGLAEDSWRSRKNPSYLKFHNGNSLIISTTLWSYQQLLDYAKTEKLNKSTSDQIVGKFYRTIVFHKFDITLTISFNR